MVIQFSARSCVLLTAFLAITVSALVPNAAEAATKEELRCQKAIAKSAANFVKQRHKAEGACRNDAASGSACDRVEADQLAIRAEVRLARKVGKKCKSSAVLASLGFPGRCEDNDGPPFTVSEVVICLRDTHVAQTDLALDIIHPGAPSALAGNALGCRIGIGRVTERYIRKLSQHRRRCTDKQLRGKIDPGVLCNEMRPPDGPGGGDPKTDTRLQKEAAKLGARLNKQCNGVTLEDLGFPGLCDDADGAPFENADLDTCVDVSHSLVVRELVDIEYAIGTPVTTTTSTTVTTLTTLTTSTSTTTMTIPDLGEILAGLQPTGDLDGDGFSNVVELAACSNPADPASDPTNDDTLCANATIVSDTLGPAWGNSDNFTEPSYQAAVAALSAQNLAECSAYCSTTPNMGSPGACTGVWPHTGSVDHPRYAAGPTIEINFPDEDGDRLSGNIFLPPDVTCTPTGQAPCDGVTDAVVCTSSTGSTYPAVMIVEGFLGAQPMHYWAAHQMAELGYITVTIDVSGQGKSQGQFPNNDDDLSSDVNDASPFSRDIGSAMNYIVSTANPARDLLKVDPMLIINQGTGSADHTEPFVLGVVGHSLGARGSITYQQSTETTVYPGRARAVIGWSHFDNTGTIGNVPIQLQTGDEDAGFIQPPGSGNIVPEMQRRYDRLIGDRDLDGTLDFTPHDRQIIVIEDQTHIGWAEGPWFYYPNWGLEVAYHYTLAWFDKYLMGDIARSMSDVSANVIASVDSFGDYAECTPPAPDCFTATERLKMVHTHLSNTWCSRYDVGGDETPNMKGGACATD